MGFVLLSVSLLLIAAGVGFGVAAGAPYKGSATEILNRRLASGEIGVEEFRERKAVIGPSSRRSEWVAAALLIAVGLAGLVVSTAAFFGRGPMQHMMSGMMNSGIGSMMRGRTDLSAPSPLPGASEVIVAAKEFVFSPQEIRIRSGETVNLILENTGEAFHTLTIEELGFQIEAEGGRRSSGALRIDRPGTFSVICSVPGHAEAGLRATLVVE